jgi:hypothetical protein
MMMEVRFSETSVLVRATRRHNPKDGIVHNHGAEALKFDDMLCIQVNLEILK